MRIAAIADFHCRSNSVGQIKPLLEGVEQEADLLILAGDLTDNGQPAELEVLLRETEHITLPKIAVLGNHDHESDQAEQLEQMLCDHNIIVLNNTLYEKDGIGFVGTKGFCGGFDSLIIQPFGERALKAFIQTSIDEAMKLENALTKLDCPRKVAILHYAPIKTTLEGEPLELYPFLGSSRLGNALDRHGVDLILHGHAHHGFPDGVTAGGIAVHNICRFVLTRHGRKPYALYDL